MQDLISRLTEWFINDELRNNAEQYTRTRMVVGGIVMSWAICVPILMFLELIFIGYPKTQLLTFCLTMVGISSWAIALLSLRFFVNFELCMHIIVASAILNIAGAILFTGGISSPVLVALIVPPVLSAIFTGKRSALLWCFVCSFVVAVMFSLSLMNISFVNMVPDGLTDIVRATFIALSCFLVVGVLYIYDEINRQLQNALEKEKQKMSKLAHHDELTGLANRLQFNKVLEFSLERAQEKDAQVALIYIDLDDFKPVNDTYGHEVGDQVLRIASQRMSQCVRVTDTVARLGGDEFAAILDGIDSRMRAELICEKLSQAMRIPMEVHGHRIQIGASLGVAVFPHDAVEIKGLVDCADQNMYERKQAKKNMANIA